MMATGTKFQATFNSVCAKKFRTTFNYNQPITSVIKQWKPKILKCENIKKSTN